MTPGSCATLIRGPLTGRYLYLYATDIDGADVLKGTVSMCIDRGKFKVYGIENCWRRGLQAVTFAEIDTLNSPDWTTFLKEPGSTAGPADSENRHLPFFREAMASSDRTSCSRLTKSREARFLRPLEKIGNRTRRLGPLHVLGDRVDQRQRRRARRRRLGAARSNSALGASPRILTGTVNGAVGADEHARGVGMRRRQQLHHFIEVLAQHLARLANQEQRRARRLGGSK